MNTNPSRIARSRSFVYPQINHYFQPIMPMLLSNESLVGDDHNWCSLSIFMPVDCTSLMMDLTLQFKIGYYF